MLAANHHKMPANMNGSTLQLTTQLPHTRVVSQTPGRMRLKVSHHRRNHREMEKIASSLRAHPDVSEVRTNVKTGSIVVHHDNSSETIRDVFSIVKDVGIIVGTVTMGKSEAAEGVTNAVTDLNQRVAHATNGLVDLRFLLPVGFAAMSVRQLLVKGLQLDIIPWYVLAWYAFDSFIKLHYTSDPHKKHLSQLTEHR